LEEDEPMAVLGMLSFTLEVPDLAEGVRFYTDAGLTATVEDDVARFRCGGQDRDSIVLLGGFPAKRLHHVTLRADNLDGIAARRQERWRRRPWEVPVGPPGQPQGGGAGEGFFSCGS
jgi:catechol 2,3-dioxygenase